MFIPAFQVCSIFNCWETSWTKSLTDSKCGFLRRVSNGLRFLITFDQLSHLLDGVSLPISMKDTTHIVDEITLSKQLISRLSDSNIPLKDPG